MTRAGITTAIIHRGRAGLLRTTALQAAAVVVFAAPAMAQPAPLARPQGGVVVGGAASIAQTTAQTTVQQASQRAAIDWRSFDVGSQHTVQFNQPNASAVVLNRVTGPDPSQIAGRIQANGQVVITNQSGVMFHKGAQVDTAGLIVSAAGISTPNFMAGRMVFDRAPKPDAMVSNAGTITVKEAGLAALVAPRVANSGVINARMGRAVLAGAETHTIDLYGDGLVAIDITRQVRQAPRGPDGKPVEALVTNTGTVVADGGRITITAAAADGIVQTLVQAGGTIRANAAGGKAGSVVIAGVGGTLRIEGRVAADGGGRVAIGDRGAAAVVVAEAAHVSANGRGRGSGGQVTVLSGGNTRMEGRISARGGRLGGNGGKTEVSGKTVGLTGRIDTAAPAGQAGHTLIDPTDVTISDHGGTGTVITPASLQAMTGSVTVQADNSIVASSSVNLTGRSQDFTLDATNFIRVDAGVTLGTTGTLTMRAGAGGVNLLGSLTTPNNFVFSTTGAVTQGAGSIVTANILEGAVGSAALTSPLNRIDIVGDNSGNLRSGSLIASVGDISVTSAAPLTLSSGYFAAGTIVPNGRTITFTADDITVPQPSFGAAAATAIGGTIALQALSPTRIIEVTSSTPTTGVLSVDARTLNQLQSTVLSLGSPGGGPVTLASDGSTIDFGAQRTIRLRSAGNIGQVGDVGIGTLDAAGANIDFSNAGNTITTVAGLAAAGNALLHTGQSLTVTGLVTGAQVVLSSAGGANQAMTIGADIRGGTVRLDSFDGNSLATSGPIVQTAGVITGSTLSGQGGAVTLTGQNAITIGDFASGSQFTFTGAAGIALNGTLDTNGSTASFTTPGAITEGAAGTLLTGTLTGTAGSLALNNASNIVNVINGFQTSTGGLALSTQIVGNQRLLIAGTNSVPGNQTYAVTADQVALLRGTISGGTAAFTPLTPGRPIDLLQFGPQQSALALSLGQGDLNTLAVGTLRLGAANAGPITIGNTGDTITLAGLAGTLDLVTPGAVTQAAGVTLTVNALTGTVGSLAMGGPNAIGALGALTAQGAVTLNDTVSLTVAGPVQAGGALSLTTPGTASAITLTGDVTAPAATLASGTGGIAQTGGRLTATNLTLKTTGAATQAGTGAITAGTLTGTVDSLAFGAAGNAVAGLDTFIATNDAALRTTGALALTGTSRAANWQFDAGSIAVNGTLQTPGTARLNALGAVTESASGTVSAATLAGTTGSILLGGANQVGTVANLFSGAGLLLNDAQPLVLNGPVVAGTTATLTSVGPLTVSGNLTAPNVALTSTGAITGATGLITQTAGTIAATTRLTLTSPDRILQPGGGIATPLLTGSAVGDVTLTGANAITGLGSFNTLGNFTLADGGSALNLSGPLNVGASTVRLTAGSLSQTLSGIITAGVLTGATTGRANLGVAANQVTLLSDFNSVGGFALADGRALVQAGVLADSVSITLNPNGPLTLGGTLSAPTVTLASTGVITQTGGGITAGSLAVTDDTAALTQPGNSVAGLGAVNSDGAFTLVTNRSLTVTGPATAFGPLRLDATGDIALNGNVTAPTVELNVTNSVSQNSGVVTATTLSGSAANAFVVNLGGNLIDTLGPLTAGTTIAIADARSLTVTGAIDPPDMILNVTGDLAIANSITAGRLTLNVTGNVTETTGGSIDADSLAGAVGSAVLQQAIRLNSLANLASNGLLTLQNQVTLAVTGPVSAGGPLSLTSTGPLTIAGDVTAPTVSLSAKRAIRPAAPGDIIQTAGTLTATTQLTLTAADAIAQTAGTIATPLLTGTAGTAASFAGANRIATLGPFSSTRGFSLSDSQSLATTSLVTDPGKLSLNTTGALSIGGALVSANIDLVATGPITEQPTASIQTTTLTGNAASATLDAPGNTVANLGRFTSAGDFLLSTPSALNITGPVTTGSGRTLTLTPGALAIQPGGSLSASLGAVALAPFTPGTPFTLSSLLPPSTIGAIDASTLRVGTPTSGDITVSGAFNIPNVGTLALLSAGSITEAPGATITVNQLTANAATVRLDQANAVRLLFESAGSDAFVLNDTVPLTVYGIISAGAGGISLSASALQLGEGESRSTLSSPTGQVTLTSSGFIEGDSVAILARSLTGTAVNAGLTGPNQVGTLAGFTTTGLRGGFGFNNIGPLAITAPVTANPGASEIDIATTGALTLQAGLSAPVVNLAAASVDQIAGTNRINALNVTTTAGDATLLGAINLIGTANVPGTLRVIDPGIGLTLFNVQTNAIDVTAADIGLAGTLATGTLRVTGASLVQYPGSLELGTLTGTVAGTVLLGTDINGAPGGTSAIGTVADLSAGGAFRLLNTIPVTLAGTNRAASVTVQAPAITLDNGTITANGVVLEAIQAVPRQATPVVDATTLENVSGILQLGATTIAPLTGTSLPVLLQVHGGTIALNDLVTPQGALTLGLDAGSAIGNLAAASLLVQGQNGSATLTGTVGGLDGFAAAQTSRIIRFDPAYTLNGCAIASASCAALSPPPLPPPSKPTPPSPPPSPPSPPLPTVRLVFPSTLRPDIVLIESLLRPDLFIADLITLDILRDPTDPDFALPNISDRDY